MNVLRVITMQSNKTKWLKKWFECLIWWNIFKARDKFFWYGKLASTNVKRIYGIGQRRNAESVEQIKVANFLQFHHSGQESSQKEYFFGMFNLYIFSYRKCSIVSRQWFFLHDHPWGEMCTFFGINQSYGIRKAVSTR